MNPGDHTQLRLTLASGPYCSYWGENAQVRNHRAVSRPLRRRQREGREGDPPRCAPTSTCVCQPHTGTDTRGKAEAAPRGRLHRNAVSPGSYGAALREHSTWRRHAPEPARPLPFKPILFLSMDSLASGGIIHFPPGPWMAVTFRSSH